MAAVKTSKPVVDSRNIALQQSKLESHSRFIISLEKISEGLHQRVYKLERKMMQSNNLLSPVKASILKDNSDTSVSR